MRAVLLALALGLVGVSAFGASLAVAQVLRVGGSAPATVREGPCRVVAVRITLTATLDADRAYARVRCSYTPVSNNAFDEYGDLHLRADVGGTLTNPDLNAQARRRFQHSTAVWRYLLFPSPKPDLGTRWEVRVRVGPTGF